MSTTDRLVAPGMPRSAVLGALGLLIAVDVTLCEPGARAALIESASWSGTTAGRLAWPALAAVIACSLVHYLAAAAATCSATRAPLPPGETVLAQLCAASANKVTPAGLGGSVVLARYLCRRTQMSVPAAAGTVSVIALGRAVAASLTLAAVAVVGPWVGFGGGTAEVRMLAAAFEATVVAHTWVVLVAAGVGAAACVLAVRARSATRLFVGPLCELLRRPGPAGALLAASGMQTLVLAIAFAAAVHVLPGGHSRVSAGALVAGYIVASAAAAAVPMPGGIGSSEAALTAVLVGGHVGLSHAVADVLVFRLVTLWLPALAGLPCARVLRRRAAL